MAKKVKSTKKTTGKTKPVAKKPEVPVVVDEIRAVATSLAKVANLPENLLDGRNKLGQSIQRFADRVQKSYATAVKNAEKAKAKAKRDAEKTERDKAKAEKTAAREKVKAERAAAKAKKTADKIAALKAEIAKLES